jgi:hypothetical protein
MPFRGPLRCLLRAILNFTPGPQGITSPLAVNLAPRGEIWPLGECSPLCSPPGVNTLYCLEEWRGKHRISPPWDNFTPRGQNSPLGDKFAPGVKLRMGLRSLDHFLKPWVKVFIFFHQNIFLISREKLVAVGVGRVGARSRVRR